MPRHCSRGPGNVAANPRPAVFRLPVTLGAGRIVLGRRDHGGDCRQRREGGFQAILGAVIAASLIGLLITPVFSRITRFFPPLVTGIVITTIGLTLMPVAARWAMGGNSHAADFGSMANIGLAAVTLVLVLVLSKMGNATISRLSILLAMVIGTVIAVFLGMADFSSVSQGPMFGFPTPFHFGMPTFHIAAILSMCIVIMVTLVETSADILAVGEIIDTKVDSRRLGNGLRADMLSSMIAPIFGSFTQSAFAQNVGLVAVTGIKSRFVVATGGVFLVVLGLLPFMGRVIAAVPTSVLGGAGIVLFGTVAASGIRTLSKVDYRNNVNLIIVATSIGFGMIPIAAPNFYDHFPSWFATIFHSGISSSAIMAITLNLAFNHFTAGNSDQQSVLPLAPSGCCATRTWLRCVKVITSAMASCTTAMATRFPWWLSLFTGRRSMRRYDSKAASTSDEYTVARGAWSRWAL
ncbi:nucleobase:cation symporter-2 family protein [Pseudomonas sp. NA13]